MDRRQLKLVQQRMRESHQKLLEMHGTMIDSLHEVLQAVTDTHVEMVKLFEADNDLEDIADDDQ